MNAIELELFRHLLVSIAEEMGVVLRKTSYSANIKERRDYSCAVYDAQRRNRRHGRSHAGASGRDAAVGARGDGGVRSRPGRCRAGQRSVSRRHASAGHHRGRAGFHRTLASRPAFYLANRAHHADVGGMSPGSMPLAREIYQEGIRIPPILIQRGGQIDRICCELMLANVRTPEEREGDLMAQLRPSGAAKRGCAKWSPSTALPRVRRNMRALQDYSERMMRAAIRELPRGVYRFEDCLDNDGVTANPVRIRVAVTIARRSARRSISPDPIRRPQGR